MCFICEGGTYEELDRANELKIAVYGWVLFAVAVDDSRSWCYTIGLTTSSGHPDLVCVDPPRCLDTQRLLIGRLAERVLAEQTLEAEYLAHNDVELLSVHPSHVATGMVGMWELRNGRPPGGGELLQIRPGPRWFDDPHHGPAQRLDVPLSMQPQPVAWCVPTW